MNKPVLSRRSFLQTSVAAGGGLMIGFHMPVALAAHHEVFQERWYTALELGRHAEGTKLRLNVVGERLWRIRAAVHGTSRKLNGLSSSVAHTCIV